MQYPSPNKLQTLGIQNKKGNSSSLDETKRFGFTKLKKFITKSLLYKYSQSYI